MGVRQALIAIEDNKPEAIKIMQDIASKDDSHGDIVKVRVLPSRYLRALRRSLIDQCTGRQVPPGKLPADVGVVVMNVALHRNAGALFKDRYASGVQASDCGRLSNP